jgi:chromosome partitioning protein
MRRISFLNFKGGVGKTSVSTNSAHKLALLGYKVLLIDCDIQANASNLIPQENRKPITLTNVLKGEARFEDAIQKARENLYLIPADMNLDKAANHIVISGIKVYKTLKNATKSLNNFDFVIFDHSPFYTAISESALWASDEMIIPTDLEPYAIEGILKTIAKLSETLSDLEHEVTIAGIVSTKVDQRYSMSSAYYKTLQDTFKERVIHSIRTDGTIKKAQSLGQTVYEYDKNSKAAEDFTRLTDVIISGVKTALATV